MAGLINRFAPRLCVELSSAVPGSHGPAGATGLLGPGTKAPTSRRSLIGKEMLGFPLKEGTWRGKGLEEAGERMAPFKADWA